MSRRLALLVATYEHEDPGLSRLTAPAHDAEALAQVLGDPAIAGFDVTVLVNEPHYRVGEAVGELFRDRSGDDLVLLYFTGHGLRDEDGRLYLAMRNTRPGSLLFTSLPAEQIDQAMNDCESRRKVLILDCCYSGAYPSGRLAKGDTTVHALSRFQGRGRTVLTASDATQYSYEGDRFSGTAVQSVFTRHLVTGLREGTADLDGDGDITLDELYRYVHDRVVEEMPQQRPKRRDDMEGRLAIARNTNWTLPAYLRNALTSPIAGDRLSALEGLDHLRRVGNALVRETVRREIQRLAGDDSRMVSGAAAELLGVDPEGASPPDVRARTGTGTVPGGPGMPRTPAVVPAAPRPTEPPSLPGRAESSEPPTVHGGREPVESRPQAAVPVSGDDGAKAPRLLRVRRALPSAFAPVRRLRERLRPLGLTGLSGLISAAAVALLVKSLLWEEGPFRPFSSTNWGCVTWYLAGISAIASAGSLCTLLPRTRTTTGPGLLLGAAAASLWGLVYFAAETASAWVVFKDVDRLALAGHAALLLAACIAAFALARNRQTRLDSRPPRALWSYVVLGTACGVAAVAVLAALVLTHQIAGLRQVIPEPDVIHRSWASPATVAAALAVPAWAAVLTPRRTGYGLVLGWAVGTAAVMAGTYAKFTELDEGVDRVWLAGAAPVTLAVLTTVLARWARSADGPAVPPRRRMLVAGLTLLPLLAAGGGELVAVTTHEVRVGVHPLSLAVSPDGRRLYVTGQLHRLGAPFSAHDPGMVAVLDATTGKPLRDPVKLKTYGFATLSQNGRYLYVTQPDTGTVTVLTTEELGPLDGPLAVRGKPNQVEVTDKGDAWVFSPQANAISLLGTGLTRSASPISPRHAWTYAALSRDGTRCYLAAGTSVSVYELDAHPVRKRDIALARKAAALAIDPTDSSRLYVVEDEPNVAASVVALDAKSGKVTGETEVPSGTLGQRLAVSANGARLYVATIYPSPRQGELSVVDTGTMKTLDAPLDLGDAPFALTVGAHDVYVALYDEGRIATFPMDNPHAITYFTLKAP